MTAAWLDRILVLIMEQAALEIADDISTAGADPHASAYAVADGDVARRFKAIGVPQEATLAESILFAMEHWFVAPARTAIDIDAISREPAFEDATRRRRAMFIRQFAAKCLDSQLGFTEACTAFRRLLHPAWTAFGNIEPVRTMVALPNPDPQVPPSAIQTGADEPDIGEALLSVASAIKRLERLDLSYGRGIRKLLAPDVQRGGMTWEFALGAILTSLIDSSGIATQRRRGRPASQPSPHQTIWVWTIEALRSVCGLTQVEARRVWSSWFPETCLDDTSGALYAHSYRSVSRHFRDLERGEAARLELTERTTQ